MHKISPKFVALLQAVGVATYVAFAGFIMKNIGEFELIDVHPIVGVSLFLLFFIISALICSSIVFGYPIYIFANQQPQKAIHIVIWTSIWLIILFLAFLLGVIVMV